MDNPVTGVQLAFGPFRLHPGQRSLVRVSEQGDVAVALGSRALDLLILLVRRHGHLLSKSDLIDAVWPGLAVEDSNLTVQISSIRRALGEEPPGTRWIETVPGRGYRFLAPVEEVRPTHERTAMPVVPATELQLAPKRQDLGPPRLSLVVLPFANRSAETGRDYLADAVTDDLTTDLSCIGGAFVIGRSSAQVFAEYSGDVRSIGAALGVRYVVNGSIRQIGTTMVRVNAELVSAETGKGLWAERFDQDIRTLGQGQGDIVRRLVGALELQLVNLESSRSLRERPHDLDAFDFVLRARSLVARGTSAVHAAEAEALFEQALQRDPQSLPAITGLASRLVSRMVLQRQFRPGDLPRAEALLAQAEALEPSSLNVIELRAFVRTAQQRWEDALSGYRQVVAADPNAVTAYSQLGLCHSALGQPNAAIPYLEEAIRRDPRHRSIWVMYHLMGHSLLLLERPGEAIGWLRRALEYNAARAEWSSIVTRISLTSALALSGDLQAAHRERDALARFAPFLTVRGYANREKGRGYLCKGLRLAGVRDHVDEAMDAGVPATAELHGEVAGLTPTSIIGAETIHTEALAELLVREQPLIIDINATGRTIPGALILPVSHADTVDESKQERLRVKVMQLRGGDAHRPVIAVGWNAEHWGSHNLVLRLLAMGCARVYWYRGGKEVWEACGMPSVDAESESW